MSRATTSSSGRRWSHSRAAVVAEMADIHRRVLVRCAAAHAVLRVGGVLEARSRLSRVVEPEANRARAPVGEIGDDGIVGVHDERGRRGELRRSPLASAPRRSRARRSGRAGRETGSRASRRAAVVRVSASGSAPSSTSKRPSSAPRAATRADAIPERRLAPARFHARRVSAPRISAAIAVVVVFPFVAETSATPSGSRAARASTAPGSTFHSTLPGSVVPPPRPTARESAPIPRAAVVSSASRTPIAGERTERGRGRTALGNLQIA